MFPSLDAPLEVLEEFQERADSAIFWGTMLLGVAIAILGPWFTRYRSKVETRITELKSEAATDVERKRADDLSKQVQQLQPRRLTPEQKKAIVRAIKQSNGQDVVGMCMLTDQEAGSYAADFAPVFRDAGWNFKGVRGFVVPSDVKNVAVIINKNASSKTRRAASDLWQVFIDLGLAENGHAIYSVDVGYDNEIGVCIAKRPANEPAEPPAER